MVTKEAREAKEAKDLPMETEKKIAQLQLLEQSLQTFLVQKQNLQAQHIEVENALAELEKTDGPVYRIIGTVMIKGKKEDVKKDLVGKKEEIDIRIKSIERQETKIKERASALQGEVLGRLKNSGESKEEARVKKEGK